MTVDILEAERLITTRVLSGEDKEGFRHDNSNQ